MESVSRERRKRGIDFGRFGGEVRDHEDAPSTNDIDENNPNTQ